MPGLADWQLEQTYINVKCDSSILPLSVFVCRTIQQTLCERSFETTQTHYVLYQTECEFLFAKLKQLLGLP